MRFILFRLGTLALGAGSEAVLPAYIVGMVLAGTISKDNFFIRRIRTLTIGFLTPFYFLPAGALVSLPAIISAPVIFIVLLVGKVVAKIFGLYPVIRQFKDNKELLSQEEIQTLQEIAAIKRRENPTWGV